ncbi:hypothetical protein LZ32DRAFT_119185 [Colletotrichum eremochloae]|nr:hypothetical protein LZ32DRAFT_119185 [Colletotrichum eremochloae]
MLRKNLAAGKACHWAWQSTSVRHHTPSHRVGHCISLSVGICSFFCSLSLYYISFLCCYLLLALVLVCGGSARRKKKKSKRKSMCRCFAPVACGMNACCRIPCDWTARAVK